MNINDFTKGSHITRKEPAKPYPNSGICDKSYIGAKFTLMDICNGLINLLNEGGEKRELRYEYFSEGWDFYETPQKSSPVETTPELILAAAEKTTVKEALKTLFPKVFENKLKFKHPYSESFGVIEETDVVYFQMAAVNTEVTKLVIDLCEKETETRTGRLISKAFNGKVYLGFPL